MTAALAPAGERRLDLDWVRIIAFALLIVYHVACFYAAFTPRNQVLSERTTDWLIAPMLALNPWRLLILFIVAGAATRYMAGKARPLGLLGSRSARLLPPLVFAMIAIAPLMSWLAARQWFAFDAGFPSFLPLYFTADGRFCRADACLVMPSWAHLWFVAYLWCYTLLLCALLAFAPRALNWIQPRLERAMRGPGIIAWPAAYLILGRLAIGQGFAQTGDLVHDWHAHSVFLPGFLFGYLLARSAAVWARFERARWVALAGGLACWALLAAGAVRVLAAGAPEAAGQAAASPIAAMLYSLDQWLWIVAMLGFARRHLAGRDGPARRYLTEAIFPFYIVHQAAIAGGGWLLMGLKLPVAVEAAALTAFTAASCVAGYEIARPVGWLRPLMGLKPPPNRAGPDQAAGVSSA